MDQDKNAQSQSTSSQKQASGCCCSPGNAAEPQSETAGHDKTAQFCSKLKQKWDRLTDADLALANENRDQLLDRISQTYSLSRDDADRQLSELENDCGMRAGDTCHR